MSIKRRIEHAIDVSDQTEVLPNNIVDKDVQSIFLPFTVMQTILLSPKYSIKNNIIIPNNFFNKCLLLCGTVMCMYVTLYGLFVVNDKTSFNTKFFYPSMYYDFCFHICGFFINFIINFVQTRTTVAFILIIQEIHRFVKDEYNTKRYIRNSWISITVTISFYLTSCVSFYIVNPTIPIYHLLNLAALIHFDCNIIYAISFIKLLKNKIKEWKRMVNYSFHDDQIGTCCNRLFQTYFQILQCYHLYKNMFHQMVLYYTVQSFLHSLLILETLIEMYQLPCGTTDQYFQLSSTIIMSFWMFNILVLQTALSLHCEAFYVAMEDSQDTCAHILLSNCTDEDKKLCKNMRRAYRASFSKMCACRLFYIDVWLLLHLAALLTNYTVVLLQFALL